MPRGLTVALYFWRRFEVLLSDFLDRDISFSASKHLTVAIADHDVFASSPEIHIDAQSRVESIPCGVSANDEPPRELQACVPGLATNLFANSRWNYLQALSAEMLHEPVCSRGCGYHEHGDPRWVWHR